MHKFPLFTCLSGPSEMGWLFGGIEIGVDDELMHCQGRRNIVLIIVGIGGGFSFWNKRP